jgi:hypothetical protein
VPKLDAKKSFWQQITDIAELVVTPPTCKKLDSIYWQLQYQLLVYLSTGYGPFADN